MEKKYDVFCSVHGDRVGRNLPERAAYELRKRHKDLPGHERATVKVLRVYSRVRAESGETLPEKFFVYSEANGRIGDKVESLAEANVILTEHQANTGDESALKVIQEYPREKYGEIMNVFRQVT